MLKTRLIAVLILRDGRVVQSVRFKHTNAIHYGNLLVTGSTGGSVVDYRIALKLVAGRRIDLRQVTSNEFRFDELQQAYETALAGAEGKVVLMAK